MVLPERPRAENTLTIICRSNSGVREVEEAGDTAVDVYWQEELMQKKTHPWSQGWPFFVNTKGASYILEEHGLCFHLSTNFLVALSGNMAVFLAAVTLNFPHIPALWCSPGSKSNIYRNTGSFLSEWSLCSESLLFTQKFIQHVSIEGDWTVSNSVHNFIKNWSLCIVLWISWTTVKEAAEKYV